MSGYDWCRYCCHSKYAHDDCDCIPRCESGWTTECLVDGCDCPGFIGKESDLDEVKRG